MNPKAIIRELLEVIESGEDETGAVTRAKGYLSGNTPKQGGSILRSGIGGIEVIPTHEAIRELELERRKEAED